jgi:hypothetical protein
MCRAVAVWGGDACALSHHNAAALHGIACFAQEAPIHISAMGGRRMPKYSAFGTIVQNPRTLTEKDVTIVDGLRVTSVERTLLDLAVTMSPAGLERVLGECLRRGREFRFGTGASSTLERARVPLWNRARVPLWNRA